jgi:hypothetical protein
MPPPRPHKTLHPKPRPKLKRVSVVPQLTEREIEKLHAQAAVRLRSVSSYAGWLIAHDLRKPAPLGVKRVRGTAAKDERAAYAIRISMTENLRERMEARAEEEMRSLSS